MAPEIGLIKLPTWTVYPNRPCAEKKRGDLSPAVFFFTMVHHSKGAWSNR